MYGIRPIISLITCSTADPNPLSISMVLPLLLFTHVILCLATPSPPPAFKACIESALEQKWHLYAFPNDIRYLLFRVTDVHAYNLDLPYLPAAVVYPRTAGGVAKVVKCAGDHGIGVQARSGGHGYRNYCLGGADGALVVDMKNMKHFQYNSDDTTATFGAGNRLGDLTRELDSVGRSAAYGVVSDVGTGGHLTIGGLGPLSRQLGAGLDQIISAQAVLANGTIVTTSLESHPDLFFAIRGAAASFALVTEFTIRTVPAPEVVSFTYNVTIAKDIVDLAPTWKAWQDYVSDPDLSRLFACTFTLASNVLILEGTYYGSRSDFDTLDIESIFAPAKDAGLQIKSDIVVTAANALQQAALSFFGRIPTHFYAKSLKFTNNTLLTLDQVIGMFQYISAKPKGSLVWFIIWDLTGGAVSDPDPTSTAYWHRDALFWQQSYIVDLTAIREVNQVSKDFLIGLNARVRELEPRINESAYPGYVDDQLEDPQRAYWGGNVERLREIKRVYDPGMLLETRRALNRWSSSRCQGVVHVDILLRSRLLDDCLRDYAQRIPSSCVDSCNACNQTCFTVVTKPSSCMMVLTKFSLPAFPIPWEWQARVKLEQARHIVASTEFSAFALQLSEALCTYGGEQGHNIVAGEARHGAQERSEAEIMTAFPSD
ncbi:FAD-linked oxidoreductase sorD [Fulvia fulva]|uniref:FAD-linked oxidoreductase sorD n=1 Tax=Passalora fulva TaxID=5499 RepID=A0A9Q8US65_PASFU|nr:FAD-linked oxidoreductase sorD [Fulvia fulva]KAK4619036.1 FAD-linked oxidoreductase sorD [Fulvia fulva]UJO20529.1 FAD-linked oxidoreductase sorD [Fulvia fulva]WPV17909.1 FAD-linked oxidoreductase sorD [Fulvia fulva]WPV33418.1 FAD-linked oxidoreductase sorD [Fulvia fulva]